MLAILEALLKWEDKLLGFPFKIVTDHEALTYLSTQQKLLSQQIQWTDYLSRRQKAVKAPTMNVSIGRIKI